jgi:cytidine deaminase
MSEFCAAELPVLLYDGQAVTEKTLEKLLPDAFKL